MAHILEGSVRKSGNKVRITAQLIDARSDTHLWSKPGIGTSTTSSRCRKRCAAAVAATQDQAARAKRRRQGK